jgi:iron-sulfur cluster repair protein YtfE (RIC family)
MDAIQFLGQEHRKARTELEKVLQAAPAKRGGLWDELSPELEVHEKIENACLYGPLAHDANGKDPALARWQERHGSEVEKVAELMAEIEELDGKDERWLAKVKEVHSSLESHIEQEEGDIFPRIGKVWDRTRLERAGSELERMKAREVGTAPSRRR